MDDTFAVSVRQAEMLLLNDAQISINEIQALPFIKDRQEALAVIQRLIKILPPKYRVEITTDPWDSNNIKLTLAPSKDRRKGVASKQNSELLAHI